MHSLYSITTTMEWYLAKIVFRIICGDGNHQPQFDEQLRLISAATWKNALAKARALGEQEQDRFINQQKQWVEWKFINVASLSLVGKLQDGFEVHYQITEPTNADTYTEQIHQKALSIASDPFAHF
jgi:hypothetical protein